MCEHAPLTTARTAWCTACTAAGGPQYERAYSVLASLVIPRPIALVTTLCTDNRTVNAAPFSFFNVLGVDPPHWCAHYTDVQLQLHASGHHCVAVICMMCYHTGVVKGHAATVWLGLDCRSVTVTACQLLFTIEGVFKCLPY